MLSFRADIDNDVYPDGNLSLRVHPHAFTLNVEATEEVLSSLADIPGLTCIRLDCEMVHVMDSKGLRCLVEIKNKMRKRGARLVLENVHASLVRFFEHLRLSEFMLDDRPGGDCALKAKGYARQGGGTEKCLQTVTGKGRALHEGPAPCRERNVHQAGLRGGDGGLDTTEALPPKRIN